MADNGFDTIQANHELRAFFKDHGAYGPLTVSRRRVDMHVVVHNPPKVKKLGELVDIIEACDKLHEKYQEMGGMEVAADEQCVIILRMLPVDIPFSGYEPAGYH